ncbi:hypothetical protein EYF80_035299 [Liparis tanakae]|uniref:Uncharacterized protein n=1 Tax=Liparis tanakae TaxID=230148 RepID=A0A4Z2GML0_9TELE|nr:hypothetical protein EYF80_035299 [Liparis tanakae]
MMVRRMMAPRMKTRARFWMILQRDGERERERDQPGFTEVLVLHVSHCDPSRADTTGALNPTHWREAEELQASQLTSRNQSADALLEGTAEIHTTNVRESR